MNFWATSRLIAMHLVTQKQARALPSQKLIILNEKDYISAIINCPERPSYNIYIQINRSVVSNKATVVEIQRLFDRIHCSN